MKLLSALCRSAGALESWLDFIYKDVAPTELLLVFIKCHRHEAFAAIC